MFHGLVVTHNKTWYCLSCIPKYHLTQEHIKRHSWWWHVQLSLWTFNKNISDDLAIVGRITDERVNTGACYSSPVQYKPDRSLVWWWIFTWQKFPQYTSEYPRSGQVVQSYKNLELVSQSSQVCWKTLYWQLRLLKTFNPLSLPAVQFVIAMFWSTHIICDYSCLNTFSYYFCWCV